MISVEDTSLPGVVMITPVVHADTRGFFMETWQARRFAEKGIDAEFVQDNFSSSARLTLRGMHYQIRQPQGKLIRVVHGEIYDVAVDLRRSSPYFGKWTGVYLSAEDHKQLWVPPGFGHGFLVTSERADVEYKCTDYYAPAHERAVRWDDPDIGIRWPIDAGEEPLLSDKDATASLLKDADSYP
jgi:dTDP-4-dehydrorhamnose 3,5-epimerase